MCALCQSCLLCCFAINFITYTVVFFVFFVHLQYSTQLVIKLQITFLSIICVYSYKAMQYNNIPPDIFVLFS